MLYSPAIACSGPPRYCVGGDRLGAKSHPHPGTASVSHLCRGIVQFDATAMLLENPADMASPSPVPFSRVVT